MGFDHYKKKLVKVTAMFVAVNILAEVIAPSVVYALTSGPSQPEVQSFEPVGTTEMVDVFSGDFTYNIPLFELPGPNGGYPFNLAYHAGIGMDQEASWVGLGWNINPGAIVRNVRGVPDEFRGEHIINTSDMKPNMTVGVALGYSPELISINKDKLTAKLNMEVEVNYNNYKGVGYDFNATMAFKNKVGSSNVRAVAGLGLSLSKNDGPHISPFMGLESDKRRLEDNFVKIKNPCGVNLGLNYGSRTGLTRLTLNMSESGVRWKRNKKTNDWSNKKYSQGYGSGLSLAGSSYVPSVGSEMVGISMAVKLKAGASLGPSFQGFHTRGSLTGEFLKHKNEAIGTPAFGYMHLEDAGEDHMSDFNRENDAPVSKKSRFLGAAHLSYDIFSVNGQGISAMYRPFRSDIGAVGDKKASSVIGGGAVGFEIGVGTSTHTGTDVNLNFSRSVSQIWNDGQTNKIAGSYKFEGKRANNKVYEPAYFKSYGEPTTDAANELEYIGGNAAVNLALKNAKESEGFLRINGSNSMVNPANANVTESREPRTTVIQPVENGKLGDNGQAIGEYNISYYEKDGSRSTLQRRNRTNIGDNHYGGFTTTNAEGVRYVYGLPAYNHRQVECQFTVTARSRDALPATVDIGKDSDGNIDYKHHGTDKYYNKTEVPAYPHSFLLTSILGTDYVDADGAPGPSDGDLGYWVKFTYKKMANDFKWRAPFHGANYSKGLYSKTSDDKASYMFGLKEIWYLSEVETKSHIAIFTLEDRKDGREAAQELQNAHSVNRSQGIGSHKLSCLKKIELYTKAEYKNRTGRPITTVNMEYDYSLCKGVPNNPDPTDNGKLTLKRLYFTYGNSSRGKLTPYVFDYQQDNAKKNPNYDVTAYDRWGNYKYSANPKANLLFPYVNQFEGKQTHDLNAAVWSLKRIQLPSGADIEINYESDDYAYVQNKTAMQMMPIAGIKEVGGKMIGSIKGDDKYLRVLFKLEQPIEQNASAQSKVNRYLDGTKQVYFKAKMPLKGSGTGTDEIISGYAEIEGAGLDEGSLKQEGQKFFYQHGYIKLKPVVKDNYHPFSVSAWQHLMQYQPEIMYGGRGINLDISKIGRKSAMKAVTNLVPLIGPIMELFIGYYRYAYTHDWAEEVDLSQAWIRLNSYDKIKYGGGIRVKQIVLKDKWREAEGGASIYGQTYDYTMDNPDEPGTKMSSGVATYEPMIGGDENALRRVDIYTNDLVVRLSNTYSFEYPINESLYPGASVGYRKVTIRSLASAKNELPDELKAYFPVNNATTGAVEQEFYTAYEYPVQSDHTRVELRQTPAIVRALQLLNISNNQLIASQGYVTELNDMHGKPKKVSYYGQDTKGNLLKEPISWMEYKYKHSRRKVDNITHTEVLVPDNTVTALVVDPAGGKGAVKKEQRMLGVDYEFFADARYFNKVSGMGGVEPGADWQFAFPIPGVDIPFGYSNESVRTYVLNKIIHRTGILESIVAHDGTSKVETRNLVWDGQTGEVLVTSVTNNFDAPIYSYNIPAHFKYEGMGAAYKNTGLSFGRLVNKGEKTSILADVANIYRATLPAGYLEYLVPGDEFVVFTETLWAKAIFVKQNNGQAYFYSKSSLAGLDPGFFLYRSGRRNLLAAKAGSITALADPTDPANSQRVQYTNKIYVPN